MQVIDDRGYLFGLINIIDALVVLVLLAVLVAGVALVTDAGSSPADEETRTEVIVFQTDAYPDFVTDAIEEGENGNDEVVAILDKSVTDLPDNESQTGVNLTRARLRAEVVVETSPDGLPTFDGERLYVGREMQLDLRSTIVDGLVVDIEP